MLDGIFISALRVFNPQSQILRCCDLVLCPKVDFGQFVEAEDLVFLSFIQTCFTRIWKTPGSQFTAVFFQLQTGQSLKLDPV